MTEPNDELAAPPMPSDSEGATSTDRESGRVTAAVPQPAVALAPVAASTAAVALPMVVGRRQFARTTPVVVDRGRASFGLPTFADRRQAGQIGLVVLMIAALGAILLARGGGSESPGIANGGSPSPRASLTASPHPSPKPSPTPAASGSPSPSQGASTPKPSPTAKARTYTVKAGDTLSGIASRFHTTVKAIVQLNGLKSPYVLHPGQVLKLP
jgi:nucleoid-associated protein YgaU